MDLEYINIIQESCEEMADIFDYDNNYTLARPYLQEAEEQKEGLIKRGIGAIIRFAQKIYGWFKEKVDLIIDTIRKKLFNNNKIIADAAEKQLEKEEAKAPSKPIPSAPKAIPATKTEPPAAKPATPVKAFSEERRKIFNSIRQIIKGLRSGSKNSYESIYNAGFGPYRDRFTKEEKSMDTYDFSFKQDKDPVSYLLSIANMASDIEMKVETIIEKQGMVNKYNSKDDRKNALREVMPAIFSKGSSLLGKPIERIKDDCFVVIIRSSSMSGNSDLILEKFKINDLNKLSHILDKGLKKNKVHDKELLKIAHEGLLGAFQLKQVIFKKISSILELAAQQFSISARKCIELLFKLSRKA